MKISKSLTFTCPGCKKTFEFDYIGEYEFVPCPVCGANLMTVKKGQTLLLEPFKFAPSTESIQKAAVLA
jgi:Zn finger protein HypA/HybF involved in hydrogenase expression